MVWPASLAAIASVLVLRAAWARRTRSHALNGAGWALMALAAGLGWQEAGAWGTSVACLAGMAAACLLLAYAALTAPAGTERASNRRAGMLPQGGEPLGLGRRVATFAISVLLAAAAGVGLALGLRSLAGLLGAGEADSTALAFFAMPLAWAMLGFYVLMEQRRLRPLLVLAAFALAGLPAFVTGASG
ncbi:hypothetical protein [Sphingosinicella sp. BN140058]|uniref:hypothetical protein n=1 Tax=Sphingosinicella sp. BN140058 TaxID=1892855 RepID=UPI001013B320|nr:hypothetical protein [Sphingosinicella sp. BN140058]QAY76733.1 hypothetical protein ETR14_09695 [Sphingosinicella sp. BN140058]